MTVTEVFRCNLPPRRKRRGETAAPRELCTWGEEANVNVHLRAIARVLVGDLSDRLVDLLELAACVYAADGSIPRGLWAPDGASERWIRHLRLEVGVRDLGFWGQADVNQLLTTALTRLSGDRWEVSFERTVAPLQGTTYLEFGSEAAVDWPFRNPDRVLMFSGGLDSLAGAVEQAARGKPLLLISHHAAPQIQGRQKDLLAALRNAFPDLPIKRIGVWVNRAQGARTGEFTQRTRSFLFWALGLVVGASVGAGGVRFFENGVVSLNLPIDDQVVGSRASRTTNPLALAALERLGTSVADSPFAVDNPFILKTKSEVVEVLLRHGMGDLIVHSCSCTRTMMQRKQGWHCGVCSQCIDRRFGIIASGAADFDPLSDYHVDPLMGARSRREDQVMAVAYVRHATELAGMTADEVTSRFASEIGRAARGLGDVTTSSLALSEMHVRHGEGVRSVLAEQVKFNAAAIIDQRLEPTSLVGLCVNGEHARPTWRGLADRICGIMDRGLPAACQSNKPLTEPHLQEICDGLLRGAGMNLEREYPTLRWASRGTKPDWSDGPSLLWVELKYVRKKADVGPIEKAIAQDLTTYGDLDRRCLFLVYDPAHHIVDEEKFCSPIRRRSTMAVHLTR